MPFVEDPYTGLRLFELSHTWGHGAPSYPGQRDVAMFRAVKHAQHGVLSWRINTTMHTGTHMNAPIHLIQGGEDLASLPTDLFFGNGIVLDVPKGSFDTITRVDLESLDADVRPGDIVVICTGWHRNYSDGLEYFGEAPGLTEDAAQWLVEQRAKLVGIDTPQVDHPLATSLGAHRGGPTMNRLVETYERATGGNGRSDHPHWNIAHKTLLAAGIPTIEQVGGDVAELAGKRVTLAATPWKFAHGDACPVRFIAMTDPSGAVRLPTGTN